jgi:hypothetical protein
MPIQANLTLAVGGAIQNGLITLLGVGLTVLPSRTRLGYRTRKNGVRTPKTHRTPHTPHEQKASEFR